MAATNEIARRRLASELARGTQALLVFNVEATIKAAATGATEATAQVIGDLARSYARAMDQNWRQVEKVNDLVLKDATASMLQRYDDKNRSRFKGGPYRANATDEMRRYAGGVLRSALASPAMYTSTLNGVIFGNPNFLDSKARQWARLNFGAGSRAGNNQRFDAAPAGSKIAAKSNTKLLGAAIPYDFGMSARPAWIIPAGFWKDRDLSGSSVGEAFRAKPGRVFTPVAAMQLSPIQADVRAADPNKSAKDRSKNFNARRVTRGMVGWKFLETGAGVISRELPRANLNFMASIFEESQDSFVSTIPNKLNIPADRQIAVSEAITKATKRQMLAAGSQMRTRLSRLDSNVASIRGR